MKLKNLLGIALSGIIVIIYFTSCKKSNNASSVSAASEIALSLNSDSSTINLSNTGTSSINVNSVSANGSPTAMANVTFNAGTANISSFKFEALKNGKAVEYVTNNLNNVDLFAITPASITAKLDTGTYTNIEIRIKLAKSTTLIPLILKGTYTSFGGAVVPLEIDFNEDAEINTKLNGKITVDGMHTLATDLHLHLIQLFKGISSADVDHATRTNGVILINSTLNSGLYSHIKTNIITAAGSEGVKIHTR